MNEAPKHTCGKAPWHLVGNSWQYTTVYDADGTPICRLDLEDWGVTEDNQADLEEVQASVASLITAAPEMLRRISELEDVLVDLLSWFEEKPSDPEWRIKAGAYGADDAVKAAREAISLAQGPRS